MTEFEFVGKKMTSVNPVIHSAQIFWFCGRPQVKKIPYISFLIHFRVFPSRELSPATADEHRPTVSLKQRAQHVWPLQQYGLRNGTWGGDSWGKVRRVHVNSCHSWRRANIKPFQSQNQFLIIGGQKKIVDNLDGLCKTNTDIKKTLNRARRNND